MRKLSAIVLPDGDSRLKPFARRLQPYAHEVRVYSEPVKDEAEMIDRLTGAEAVLPMGGTRITAEILARVPSLRYIGLGATLFSGPSSNIDLDAAAARSIEVTGVRDYGDNGVAEWVAACCIRWLKAPERNQELAGTHCGVVGAGAAGGLTARRLKAFGADVSYYSRSRKEALEKEGIGYLGLDELLEDCRIVSVHLPRNIMLIGERELALLGEAKLLINTSVGLPIEIAALREWLTGEQNRFAADIEGIADMLIDTETNPRIIYLPRSSGYTAEAAERMYAQVEKQLRSYLDRAP